MLYLDTSVLSAAEDARAPERQTQTLAFLDRAEEFELATSELTRQELAATPDAMRRERLRARLAPLRCIGITDEMQVLARDYVEHEIIPAPYEDDAVHIAAAVPSGQDILASWSFRHRVNRRRRALVNLRNASRGLPTIDIVTPPGAVRKRGELR